MVRYQYVETQQIFLRIDSVFCNLTGLIYSKFSHGAFSVSRYNFVSCANRDSFTSSFPLWMPVISSSCLLARARTWGAVWRGMGGSGHLVSFLVFGERSPSASSERDGGRGLYCVQVHPVYTHFLESFYHEWMSDGKFTECHFGDWGLMLFNKRQSF